ncbi:MAG: hypothetical protein ACLFV3_09270 [Phycisphaeraceae bacterium]
MGRGHDTTPGGYIEANLDTIHDGKLRLELEGAIKEAFRQLMAHEKRTGSLDDKAVVTLKVGLARQSEEFVGISYETTIKPPKASQQAMVRAGRDRLLAELGGDSLNAGDQLSLPTFDRFGGRRAPINPATGEVLEHADSSDGDVAGSIAHGSAG